ncbi:ATP-binding protein [Streptomyces iakyrus]|uniref:ATP-binding protein n=1 Tax=Streptomyces iakyrus TaxID=68219 RepID=UPI003673D76A
MAYMIDRCPSEESPRLGAMTLHPVAESVPRARRWFRKFIAPYNPACSVDDCVLMISELVTNAIAYGRSDEPWLVRVEWFREGASLRVDVHNPGFPANVRLRHPDANDSHGRGLLLVDSLAESWHAAPSRFGGTVVSFLVADAWPGR